MVGLLGVNLHSDVESNDNDNLSQSSSNESICPNRLECVNIDDESDSGANEELTNDEQARKSAFAFKKIGNMSRKALDNNAITDIFIVGK